MVHQQRTISTEPTRKSARQRAMDRQMNILFYITMFCVFGHSLRENVSISISIPSIVERVMTVGGFGTAMLMMNRRDVAASLRKNPCVYVLMAFAGFAALMTASSFINKDTVPVFNPVTFNLMYLLFMLEALCIVLYARATGKIAAAFNFWFHLMLVFVLLNDALMLSGVVHFSDGQFETYLVGTKFDVVYMHMNLMALYFTRMKLLRPGKKRVKLPLSLLVTFLMLNVIVSLRVDCNTGMLGSIMVIAIIFYFDRHEKRCRTRLCSVRAFVIISIISMMFAYYIFWIIEQPIVQYIIVDKLGRSLTLTGRTEIYELYPSVMSGHWIWGYGLGNANPVCYPAFGYMDVQNAILQWVLEIGVPATFMMFVFFSTIISVCKRKKEITVIIPVVALIYVYLLLGTVEITLNRNFCMMMITILLLSVSDQLPNKRLGIAGTSENESLV